MAHRHRPTFSTTHTWVECVNPDICNRRGYGDRFHGNIVERQRCPCAAYRYVEYKCDGQVASPWRLPTSYEARKGGWVERDFVVLTDSLGRTAVVYADKSAMDFDRRAFESYWDMFSQWRGGPPGEVRVNGSYDRSCQTRTIIDGLKRLGNITVVEIK